MPPSPTAPQAAIEWHRKRLAMPKAEYDALTEEAKKRAFTVAGTAQLDLIASVQNALESALEQGTDLEAFKAAVGEKLQSEWVGSKGNPASRLETIFRTNVQCLVPGQTVEGRFVAASKARYAGDVLQLRTKAGRHLTVTPNHPVLTPYGFVAAQHLRNGDNVFARTGDINGGPGLGLVQKNEQDRPALVEDVFRSLAGEPGRIVSRALGPLDLHGDAARTDGHVDVVRSDGELLRNIKAKILDGVREFILALSAPQEPLVPSLCGPDLLFQRNASTADRFPGWRHGSNASRLGLLWHGGPFDGLGLRCASPTLANAFQKAIDLPSGQPELLRQRRGAIASLVALYDDALRLLWKGNLQPTRLGLASHLDASISEPARQRGRTDSGFIGKLLHGSSGLIATDQIVEVGHGFFRGHVYDLQTEGGWYVSQRLLISNCAYNAGRHAEATDPDTLAMRPYWQFDAVVDGRTTGLCKTANGVVLPADHPWWKRSIPPLHFNCRSTFHPLTRRQAAAAGIAPEPPLVSAAEGFGAPPT